MFSKTFEDLKKQMLKYCAHFAEKAHPIFVQNDWRWNFDAHIPSEKEIALTCKQLVEECKIPVGRKNGDISSGRIHVYIDVDPDGNFFGDILLDIMEW